MKIKNRKLMIVFVFGCVAVLAIAGLITLLVKSHFGEKDRICEGVQIGSVQVGGMTSEEAAFAVEEFVSKQENRNVIITVGEERISATAGELGFSYDKQSYIEESLAVGKEGNIWKRLKEIGAAEQGKKVFTLEADINEDTLTQFVQDKCSIYDIKMKNSRLKMKNGSLTATKSRSGRAVQVSETVEKIKQSISSESDEQEIIVEAVVEEREPEYTQEMTAECTDVLGSYTTTYSTYQAARSSNVSIAANYINGTMMYPGETFSTVEVIKDRTEANGYQSAPEYSSGKVVEGIGGGVCQVSTTLYNAVINAELKVVERAPHSMVVGYVDVSRDAAIAGDYKDFKFKNNSELPIYIVGSAYGGTLSFTIYGKEERAENRTISFEPEITATIEPGNDVVTEDPQQPPSYREVTQTAHVGYRATLWKIIKVDGVEKKRVQINTSSYSASPQYVTVGKQDVEPTATPKASEKSDKKSDKNKSENKTNTPTPKPSPTPKKTSKPSVTATAQP